MPRVVLDLPLNVPTPLDGDQFEDLAAEAACGLPVQQVKDERTLRIFRICQVVLNRETRKLLVRLDDGLAR